MTAGVYSKLASVALVGAGLLSATPTMAAESAKGVYLLGFRSQYAGVLPGAGAFYQNDVLLYSGSAGANVEVPIGGILAANFDATAILELPTFMYFTPAFGGLFGVTYTQPMGWQDVSVSATYTDPDGPDISGTLSQDDFQFGDPFVNAFLGWNDGNWHWNISAGVNVPIGQWEEGSLVNLGFNRWAVDVTGAVTYLDMATGLEASAALGFTFNGDNLDLDYKTGTEMHIEWSLTQITQSGFSFGIAGYHYQQLTGDSGSEAKLGAFKGQVTAIGPALGLTVPMADRALTAKFRSYYEFNVENRLEGLTAMGTLAIPLQPATN